MHRADTASPKLRSPSYVITHELAVLQAPHITHDINPNFHPGARRGDTPDSTIYMTHESGLETLHVLYITYHQPTPYLPTTWLGLYPLGP